MKFVIFIIVMGIRLIKSQHIEQRNKLTLDDLIKKCGVSKCPPVEDPRCLKLVHKEHSNRTLFIITANKCEKIYAECHGGFDAKFVSMKYCEHKNLRRGHKNKPNMIRKKRSLTPLLRNDGDVVCPRQCAAGDTLLCARWQHGVYRSFLSDCHMRMFLCQNKDEELELESRLPCTFSSPYLLEPDMVGLPPQRGPQGDDDTVMRFILCRDKYNVETEDALPKQFINDPECQFKGLKTSDAVQNNNEGKSLLLPPLPNDDADKKFEQSRTEKERDSDDKEEKADPKDSREETPDKQDNKQETEDNKSQDINEDILENPSNKDSLADINEEELANLSNKDNQEGSSGNKDNVVGSNEIEFANATNEASLEDKNEEELANKTNKESSSEDGTDPDKPLKLIGNRYVVGEKGHGIPGLILDIGDIDSDTARSN